MKRIILLIALLLLSSCFKNSDDEKNNANTDWIGKQMEDSLIKWEVIIKNVSSTEYKFTEDFKQFPEKKDFIK